MEWESMCSISVWRIKKSHINCMYNIWLDKQVYNAIVIGAMGLNWATTGNIN